MLANMLSNNLTVLRVGVSQDILDKVVSVLVTSDVNQGNPGTVMAAFANSVKIPAKEINSTNLEALLDNFGSKLIHAVLRSISDDMINCTTTISRSSMLTNMLDTPVSKLSMSDNIDACKHLLDTWSL